MTRESLVEKRDQLLWDILQELTVIKHELKKLNLGQGENTKGEVGGVLQTTNVKMYKCKYCGGEHEKPQQITACARKNKKKG